MQPSRVRKAGRGCCHPHNPRNPYQSYAVRGILAAASCGLRSSAVVVDLSGSDERVAEAACTVAVLRAFNDDDDGACDSSISVPFFGLRGAVDAAGMVALRSCGIEAGLVMQRIMSSAVAAKLARLKF